MSCFRVFFEVFGRKLVHEIEADSEEDAKYKILGKVIFHKVENKDEGLTYLKNIFGFR